MHAYVVSVRKGFGKERLLLYDVLEGFLDCVDRGPCRTKHLQPGESEYRIHWNDKPLRISTGVPLREELLIELKNNGYEITSDV